MDAGEGNESTVGYSDALNRETDLDVVAVRQPLALTRHQNDMTS